MVSLSNKGPDYLKITLLKMGSNNDAFQEIYDIL